MKSCLGNSYYMGISYRPTQRPSLKQKQWGKDSFNSLSCCSLTKQEDEENIIHGYKNIQRAKQVIKSYNPFLARKLSENKERKKKTTTHNVQNQQFFKLKKIDHIKTEGDQSNVAKLDEFTISIVLPQKSEKLPIQYQQKISIPFQKTELTAPLKKYSEQNNDISSIFDHFPSKLSLKNDPIKPKYYFEGKAHASRLSNFFFPTNRIKTEHQRSNSKSIIKISWPLSCKPRKKSSVDTRLFNFDGTLQNHKMVIPLRPQTADNQTREPRKHGKQGRFWNYEDIAKRCIKMKQGKRAENNNRESLNIRPWVDPDEERGLELFDISCSSIRGQFSIEL